jgi:hypothetical protein
LGLVATKAYKKDEFVCIYGGIASCRWGEEADEVDDRSKVIGIDSETFIDGANSQTRGPRINTGVPGVPFLANNIAKKKHEKKGAPWKTENNRNFIPLLASKDIEVGDELMYRYGSGYGGYQNKDKALFKKKDILARADQIYSRECNAERNQEFFDAMVI